MEGLFEQLVPVGSTLLEEVCHFDNLKLLRSSSLSTKLLFSGEMLVPRFLFALLYLLYAAMISC